ATAATAGYPHWNSESTGTTKPPEHERQLQHDSANTYRDCANSSAPGACAGFPFCRFCSLGLERAGECSAGATQHLAALSTGHTSLAAVEARAASHTFLTRK